MKKMTEFIKIFPEATGFAIGWFVVSPIWGWALRIMMR